MTKAVDRRILAQRPTLLLLCMVVSMLLSCVTSLSAATSDREHGNHQSKTSPGDRGGANTLTGGSYTVLGAEGIGEVGRGWRRDFHPAEGSTSSSSNGDTTTTTTTDTSPSTTTTTSATTTTTTTDTSSPPTTTTTTSITTTTTEAPAKTRIPQGSTLILVEYILKPVVESEGTAVAVGMAMGVLVFIIYLVCLRYCFQDIGSERSRKWFKVPKNVEGHPGQQHGGFGGPGSLQGSASHLNGLGTLTGGDPAAEYQLRMLLNSMVTGSPVGGGSAAGSPAGGGFGGAPAHHYSNSFNATAVRSESFRGGGAAAAPPAPQNTAAAAASDPNAINSNSAPLAGSPPMAPPR